MERERDHTPTPIKLPVEGTLTTLSLSIRRGYAVYKTNLCGDRPHFNVSLFENGKFLRGQAPPYRFLFLRLVET